MSKPNEIDFVAARTRLEGLQRAVDIAKESHITQKARREGALKALSQASGDLGVENSRKGVLAIGKRVAAVDAKLAAVYTQIENDFPFEW